MRRMLLVLLLVGAVVAGAIWVAPARTARRARVARNIGHVKIPLPAPQHSQVSLVTVKVNAPRGKTVGSLTVRTTNDGQLGNLSAVAVIKSPRKQSASATFNVYVVLHRWQTVAREQMGAATTADGSIDLIIVASGLFDEVNVRPIKDVTNDCLGLNNLNDWFESGLTVTRRGEDQLTLRSLRSPSAQPSPKESVLDSIVADAWTLHSCPGAPETPDDGDK
jgi:hypothetical protein